MNQYLKFIHLYHGPGKAWGYEIGPLSESRLIQLVNATTRPLINGLWIKPFMAFGTPTQTYTISSSTLQAFSYISRISVMLLFVCSAQIQLSADKCRLGYQQIEFVRHLITPSGTPEGQTRITTLPGPRKFITGLIPNMATIPEPLYSLTRKGMPYSRNQAYYEAFRPLTRTLRGTPCYSPTPTGTSHSICRSSCVAVGCVLSQLDANNKLRSMSFYSTSFNASQRNYAEDEIV